ncbi:glycosyltransferase family 39 protein [Microbacterium sp.]|uniref:glycosyltransferase family 39 protein n=1 Tax=Microbacterium sp. TaxID=51671 RepID=UPI003A90436F
MIITQTQTQADAAPAIAAAGGHRPLAAAAAGMGALAFVLGVAGSWIPSLWGDEATSVMSATRPLGSLLQMLTRVDAVHGLYYVVLHGWIEVFGSSPFAVRFPSAIGVAVCAAAVVWLTGRVVGLPTAVLAGLFAAVLPRLTYAAEETRSYAFDAAIAAVLCAIVVEILLRRPTGRRWWVAYAAVLALGTYSFLYVGLMSLAAGFAVVTHRRSRLLWRRWLQASAVGLAAAIPLFVFAVLERHQIAYLTNADAVSVASVFVQMWFGKIWFADIAWVLIGVAILAFIIDLVRRARTAAPHAGETADAVHLEPLVIAWLVVPMGVLIAVSPLMADFTSRYGTLAAPAAAILMALGVRRLALMLRARAVAGAAAGLLALVVVVAAVPIWASQRTPFAKNSSDWNQIAQVVSQRARPGDAVVFDASARPSRRPRLAMDTDPAAFRTVRDVLLQTPYPHASYWWDDTYTVAQAAAMGRFDAVRRVWLVEYAGAGRVDTWGLSSLQSIGFHPVETIRDHSSEIVLLTTTGTDSAPGLTR